jgi:hypothetical protein
MKAAWAWLWKWLTESMHVVEKVGFLSGHDDEAES